MTVQRVQTTIMRRGVLPGKNSGSGSGILPTWLFLGKRSFSVMVTDGGMTIQIVKMFSDGVGIVFPCFCS